jgi:hypothetical protein
MTRLIFDPSRLGGSQEEADRHVARLLRDYLGGDPLAGLQARFNADPAMRQVLEDLRRQSRGQGCTKVGQK